MADDLVDRLLAQTGLYLGIDRDPTKDDPAPQVARIVVTALPGRSGVMFDYEGLSLSQERPRPHAEHAVLGRTSNGPALYTAHIHAPVLTELRETEPGYFRGGRRCVTVPPGDSDRGAIGPPPHLHVVVRRTRR